MKKSLEAHLSRFFHGLQTKDDVILTTFGLDEGVAYNLLKMTDRRFRRCFIVYDAHRRRNPGLLSQLCQRVRLRGIVLRGGTPEICPIFHSKVWIAMRNGRAIRLAVHSFNLTGFHLERRASSGSFESWAMWDNLSIPVPKELLRLIGGQQTDWIVRGVHPGTLIVDARSGVPQIEFSRHSAGVPIRAIPGDVLGGAAPFLSFKAISHLRGAGDAQRPIPIWTGSREVGPLKEHLHLKFLSKGSFLVLGSSNLTMQALWGAGERDGSTPINHETVLILPSRSVSGGMAARMVKFQKYLVPIDADPGLEFPGDDDGEEDESQDFADLRIQALASPEVLILAFNPRAGVPILKVSKGSILGKRCRHTQLRLTGPNGMSILLRTMPNWGKIAIPASHWRALAAMILSRSPIAISGETARHSLWKRELDLGDFWSWFSGTQSQAIAHESWVGNAIRGKTAEPLGSRPQFIDVRSALRDLYQSGEGDQRPRSIRLMHEWLIKNARRESSLFPRWCESVVAELREG